MDIVTPGFEPEYQRIVVLLQSGQDSNLYATSAASTFLMWEQKPLAYQRLPISPPDHFSRTVGIRNPSFRA